MVSRYLSLDAYYPQREKSLIYRRKLAQATRVTITRSGTDKLRLCDPLREALRHTQDFCGVSAQDA